MISQSPGRRYFSLSLSLFFPFPPGKEAASQTLSPGAQRTATICLPTSPCFSRKDSACWAFPIRIVKRQGWDVAQAGVPLVLRMDGGEGEGEDGSVAAGGG